ncbi:MAG: 6-phosphogluconolactonase [Myxococcales bacterium]|nr:6-phosphogluconolactonase [Myxococcales bacterium]
MAVGLVAESLPSDSAFELIVSSDPVSRAAEILTEALSNLALEKEIIRLAIPGGSALDVAARSRAALGERWSRIALTWVDERCVPEDDRDSNRGAAARLGLVGSQKTIETIAMPLGCDPESVLGLYADGEKPEEAALRSAGELRDGFGNGIDVSLLGMGGDGHVASLFPGRWRSTQAMVVHVSDSPKPPSDRITLTRRALETACFSLLVVVGESKRRALTQLVGGDESLPAWGLPGLVIVTDLDLTC